VRAVPGSHLDHGQHDLRPHADPADSVVHRLLAFRQRQGRDLGAEPAADTGDQLVPNRVDDAAPIAVGAGAPRSDRLTGTVEVDETFIGGDEPGLKGGRARGKKVLTVIAVEADRARGLGRCRMAPLTDASSASLHAFITEHVAPGATVITDGWQGYRGLDKLGYVHDRRSQRAARARGDDPAELLPAVHRVASLIKRWLLGTHQGSAELAHMHSYMDEFVFRFNRRRSHSRGLLFYRLLELAVAHEPVRYNDLIASKRPRNTPPTSPGGHRHPASLDRPAANRPWRATDQHSSA